MNEALVTNRRKFIRNSVATVGSITVGLYLPSIASASSRDNGSTSSIKPNAWIEIPLQGRIRFICGRSEMGQGSSTGLAMLVCEELEISLEDLDLVMAPANRAYDHPAYFVQTTGGSSSIHAEFKTMLQAGASVRELFKQAAAKHWQVKADEIKISNSVFSHPSAAKTLSYTDLVPHAQGIPLPKITTSKLDGRDPSKWRVIGKRVPRLDNLVKATGAPIFGIDAQPAGFVSAWVMHGPNIQSRPVSFNEKDIAALPGILQVVLSSLGVAIIAKKYWQAKAAGEKHKVEWANPVESDFSSAEHLGQCVEQTKAFTGSGIASNGRIEIGANTIEAVYELPFLAHTTLEPQNCTVQLNADSCEVWVPTQSPGLVVPAVRQLTGLSAEKIKVNAHVLRRWFWSSP
jgi:isoquinoline 1-oxidoreductase subunit beta